MYRFFASDRKLTFSYLVAALVVSLQSLAQGFNRQGYTAYENYVIFKNSFVHLLHGQNPYASYPAEQCDLFKYSPTFALLMAPFAALPDWLGLQVWNLANALPLLWAILRLPGLDTRQRRFLGWFVLPELVISMQNSQSNGLTAALLLWAWVALESQGPKVSAFYAAFGGFLKIFGIFAAAPALVYPQRGKFFFGLAAWAALLLVLPLLAVGPEQLVQVYRWWFELLQADHGASLGLSVIGWLESWWAWAPPKTAVLGLGLGLLGLSIAVAGWRAAAVSGLLPAQQRQLLWASVLLWVVIFNHKAESPTFVIALCGVGLWYLSTARPAVWKKILLWTAFLLASVSPTDIFPRQLREQIVQPYVLKAVPCIIIWIILTLELFFRPKAPQQVPTSDEQ
ncbi:MAG: DUF2029 domain-containing protein [Saprospiraceae bacterium]|nr:DUF2029 domain-containing protein [Saprospiraceae bacterium]